MPTYEYACRDCGEHLEVVQSFKDDALTVCPSCDGSLRKVFSAAGLIFKGSGWHVKDYATSGRSTAGSSEDSSDTSSTSTKSEGADAKSPKSGGSDSSSTSSGSSDTSTSGESSSKTTPAAPPASKKSA